MLTVRSNEDLPERLKFISIRNPCTEEVKYNVDMQGYLYLTVDKFYTLVILGWISAMDLRSVIYCSPTFKHDEWGE